MKRTLIFLICLFQIIELINGQSNDSLKFKSLKDFDINMGAVQTSLLAKKFYGINWTIRYFPNKRFGTGLYLIFCQRKISDTFTYQIQKPIIDFYEIGWINQYSFLQRDKVRMNLSLINGFSQARLGDNAIKERQHKNMPKEIASNYFYSLEPGAGISIRLSSNNDAEFWLTSETNYRFVFGKSKYAMTNEFSGYLFGVGVSVIEFH
ncbi:MAG: hypothetical protein ACHQF0_15910 [Chitinophagales bacterium]